ncbi:MAG: rhodanese-related sulfurtransferase [Breznakibacter sp.]
MQLHNRLGKKELIEKIKAEPFKRKTLSFYRYTNIQNPQEFRNELYLRLAQLQCNGRIYVAQEGINAQMSIPEHHVELFLALLNHIEPLKQMPIKWALDNDPVSFLKLIIKVRPKIVADGLTDTVFDTSNVGNHLSPIEFHNLADNEDVVVVDMRNNYESEVGRFARAYCPNVNTFREEVELVAKEFAGQKEKKMLLYCTGGVRCEKASAWLKHLGFKDVNQLHGGIIAYANEIKAMGIKPKFLGKNFVFDDRLGERITNHVLSTCHQCGTSCDTHYNCAHDECHKLIIQCPTCRGKFAGCCSNACHNLLIQNSIVDFQAPLSFSVRECQS